MRVLMYAHNTTGFGHVRRLSRIAAKIREIDGQASIVIVTGARRGLDEIVPDDVEIVKLPSLKGVLSRGRLQRLPASLNVPLDHLIEVRVSLLRALADTFDPDVFLVDHQPAGLGQELAGLLQAMSKDGRHRLVFGMRGFHQPDAGEKIFNSEVNLLLLRTCYERLLIYCDPRVVDVARLFNVEADIAQRLEYVGYVAPDRSHRCLRRTNKRKGGDYPGIGDGRRGLAKRDSLPQGYGSCHS